MRRFIACIMFGWVVCTVSAQFNFNFGKNSPIRKLEIAEIAIQNLYVDTVQEDRLVEEAIRGMLNHLDPHSSYTTVKETKAMTEALQGSFDGIGIQFNMMQDTLMVIQTIANGPSEKVGIMAGDREQRCIFGRGLFFYLVLKVRLGTLPRQFGFVVCRLLRRTLLHRQVRRIK